MSKKLAFTLVALAMVACVFELGFWLVAAPFLRAGGWTYEPPTREQFVRFVENADPELGWISRTEESTAEGYRISPASEGKPGPCVSVYGDSFAWGEGVLHDEAWTNVLADLLGCGVDNYGVTAYGSDQAFLRYRGNRRDVSQVVILLHQTENIIRNVNQDFTLLYTPGILVHPIFVRGPDGELELVPMPRLGPGDHESYVRDMGRFLKHEYFLPNRTTFSKRTVGFPHLWRVPAVVLLGERTLRSIGLVRFGWAPWYQEFYEPDHPSGALDVTEAVLRAFVAEARARGQRPVVFLLPNARDMHHYRHSGVWSHAQLADRLSDLGDEVVPDLATGLVERAGDAPLCDFFCNHQWKLRGHYNPRGNAAQGEWTAEWLHASGALSVPGHSERARVLSGN